MSVGIDQKPPTREAIGEFVHESLQQRIGNHAMLLSVNARNVRYIGPDDGVLEGPVTPTEGHLEVACWVDERGARSNVVLEVNGNRQGLSEETITVLGAIAQKKPAKIEVPARYIDKINLPGYWLG